MAGRRSVRPRRLIGLGLVATLVLTAADSRELPPYEALLPAVLVGDGDPVLGAEPHRYALTEGLVLSAAVAADDEPTAVDAEAWLLSDLGPGGWGAPWSWDPFGDGSVTASGVAFGITTAIAIDGLLDRGMDASVSDRVGQVLLDWARRAWSDGFYWYSMAPQDAIDTPNVSAMLAGATARYLAGPGRTSLSVAERQFLAGRVRVSFDHLASQRTSGLLWRYAVGRSEVNDLSHHVYILWGAEAARDAGVAVPWSRSDAMASIDRFDVVYPRGVALTPAMAARTGTEWQVSGAGMALAFTATWGGDVARWRHEAVHAVSIAPFSARFAAHALLGYALAGMTLAHRPVWDP